MTLLDAEPGSAVVTVTPKQAWRAARAPIAIALVVVLVAIVAAIRRDAVRGGYLHDEAARPAGGRAVAQILDDRGVVVTRRSTPQRLQGTTTFVPVPGRVSAQSLRNVLFAPGQDVVVVGADDDFLDDLGVEAGVVHVARSDTRDPGCSFGPAVTAGPVRLGGYVYSAGDCYDGTLMTLERGDARVTFVGDGDFITNEFLDEDGNAALALGLLARHGRLDWVLPEPEDVAAPEGDKSLLDLVPRPAYWGLVQLLVAAAFAAAWRARRLGPVVAEPLPVVVRAAEAVEGRARLYEGGRARDRAAAALRAGARDRLQAALGLGRDARPEAVCEAIAARTRRPASLVEVVLYGPPPEDDAGLVRLASDLDSLQAEVRRS